MDLFVTARQGRYLPHESGSGWESSAARPWVETNILKAKKTATISGASESKATFQTSYEYIVLRGRNEPRHDGVFKIGGRRIVWD
jgi:hypothetical protein